MLRVSRRQFAMRVTGPDGKKHKLQTKLLIDGQWVDSVSGKTFAVHDPSTGKVITRVAAAQKEDVDLAVKAAKKAFHEGEWAKMSPMVRQDLMMEFANQISAHSEELTAIECNDNGKPPEQAGFDIMFSSQIVKYFAAQCHVPSQGRSFSRHNFQFPWNNQHGYTTRQPIGVCGLISPWNFPALLFTMKLAPMLASGCTAVMKPAELTPLSALKIGEIWTNIKGAPPGVINMVPGMGDVAGEAIVDHPEVRKISFTGSTEKGRRVMQRSSQNFKRLTLELGGKGPCIVFNDANIDKAAYLANYLGTLSNGQFCGASTRLIVQEGVYDQFVEKLTAMMKGHKIGRFDEPGVTNGPVISQKQLDRVLNYIKIGQEEGARLVTGGKQIARDGFFVEPTLFADVKPNMRIAQEEIFGPVLSVIKFRDMEEAIAIANNSEYGLFGGVYSSCSKTCHEVANRVHVGHMTVNNYFANCYDSSFGGVKNSGFGRDLGPEALESFLEPKTIVWDFS